MQHSCEPGPSPARQLSSSEIAPWFSPARETQPSFFGGKDKGLPRAGEELGYRDRRSHPWSLIGLFPCKSKSSV